MRLRLLTAAPVAVFVVVMAASVLLLVASNHRARSTITTLVAVQDNLAQSRIHVNRAVQALTALAAGDPTVSPEQPRAELGQALDLLGDIAAGRSSVLDVDAAPLTDPRLDPAVEAYRNAVSGLLAEVERSDEAGRPMDVVTVRVRAAALHQRADELRAALHDMLRGRLAFEEGVHRVGLTLWIAFLLAALASFLAVRRARFRAEKRRAAAQEARLEAHGRYLALAAHAAAGLVRTDPEGRVLEAAGEWKGDLAGGRDPVGAPWWAALDPDEAARVARTWDKQSRSREVFALSFRLRREGHPTRWFGSRWVPDRTRDRRGQGAEGAKGWVGTFIEETEERRLEHQLQRAQRLELIGRLTGSIAHDFNNLLSVILANAELLAGAETGHSAGGGEEVEEMVSEMATAARSGRDLVARLLGFSREMPLEIRPLDLAPAIREVAGMARRLLPPSIELVIRPGPGDDEDSPQVLADPRALQQILLNLVSNARDAMPEGGVIRIEIDASEVTPEFLEDHPWMAAGRYGRITVSDQGTGMDADTMAQVFDPFFTTKPEGEGTGLGLSTVHGLVRQHGGHIHLYSEPGQGTSFRIQLPVTERALPERVETGDAPAEPALPAGLRILVVDDEPMLRTTAARILTRLGHDCVSAGNGREALDLLAAGEDVDLIISDLSMDVLDGLALYNRLQKEGRGHPFVFTSGYSPDEMASRRKLPSDAIYLTKPWTIDELKEAMRRALSA